MPRLVTLGFSSPKRWNPLSFLIKWWWNTSYSHVYLRWSTPWGFDEILEAARLDVHMKEASLWEHSNKTIKSFQFTLEHDRFDVMMRDIRVLCGRSYGWKQVFGSVWTPHI